MNIRASENQDGDFFGCLFFFCLPVCLCFRLVFGFGCVVVWLVTLLCLIGAMILEFTVPVISWQVFLAKSGKHVFCPYCFSDQTNGWIQLKTSKLQNGFSPASPLSFTAVALCRLCPGNVSRVSRVSHIALKMCILEQANPGALIPSYMGCLSGASMSAQSTGGLQVYQMCITRMFWEKMPQKNLTSLSQTKPVKFVPLAILPTTKTP